MHKQSLQSLTPIFLKSAQELIPEIKFTDIEESEKVGIRAQLFNLKDMKLEDDLFVSIQRKVVTYSMLFLLHSQQVLLWEI